MAHRHVRTMVRQWFLLLQLIWAPSGAVGTAPISTECPDKFKEGEISTIRCYIDPAAVSSSGCVVIPTDVSLAFLNTAGQVTTLCSTSYRTCTNSTNCGCLSSSGSIHTYWFSFTAEGSYSGGSLTCDLNCGYSFVMNNTKGCQTVTFEQMSSPTTLSHAADHTSGSTLPSKVTELTSNSVSTSATRAVYKQEKSACDATCIGLAAGVTSSVVILIAITIILMKIGVIRSPQRCCKEAENTSRQSQENNAETNTMSKQENRASNQPATNTKESKVTAPKENKPMK